MDCLRGKDNAHLLVMKYNFFKSHIIIINLKQVSNPLQRTEQKYTFKRQ